MNARDIYKNALVLNLAGRNTENRCYYLPWSYESMRALYGLYVEEGFKMQDWRKTSSLAVF